MSATFRTEGAVALLTIDRPEALNALNVATLHALREIVCEVRDRSDLRALVLTGSGTRAFCAGADLKGTQGSPGASSGVSSGASYAEALFHAPGPAADLGLYLRLMDLSNLQCWKPMIAAVNGHCLGAGIEIALQCDLRIASAEATFGLPEVRVGSIPGVSGLHRLLKAVPSAYAMRMALTGERIDAAEAARIGLVSEVTAPGELVDRAMALAHRIAANAPLAVQAVKKLARQTAHLSDADAQEITELYWGALRDTADRIEGRAAFAEKRPPAFTGR
ncbi:enoyl-CoA hydratase/isomerase family protein [Cupriavidus plantarum]|uniref:enoyl-CoA hydratase/isomerase family protein n=1 Tax=Cupriavidus plantarum TaxID=942865 RepID=UPI001B2F4210|nr:enoyl-CoA hydratase-related protein [Cupriavidus plantarum]CAG2128569.1 Carnitinyl-CoA dehydratase [Cupriavidus plantarum]SMR66453.1 Enoyl-CoA hydratase/carnithine racemase [Cupriavidus plantarum]